MYFDCNQWLSADRGDGRLERTLSASAADPSLSRCPYLLTLHTSNLGGAGLAGGASVSLVLAGARGALPRAQLLRAGAFARGAQDVFELVGPGEACAAGPRLGRPKLGGRRLWV